MDSSLGATRVSTSLKLRGSLSWERETDQSDKLVSSYSVVATGKQKIALKLNEPFFFYQIKVWLLCR